MSDLNGFCWLDGDGNVHYSMHGGQVQGMESEKDNIVLCGGTRSGKSSSGGAKTYQMMERGGPGRYLVAAPSYPLLEAGALPYIQTLFEDMLGMGKVSLSGLSNKFILNDDGARRLWGHAAKERTSIVFGHAQKPNSLEAATYKGAWLDEVGQPEFKLASYWAIQRRLSTINPLTGRSGPLFMTTTPYSIGWFYESFYLPWLRESEAGRDHPDIDWITFPSYANPTFDMKVYWKMKAQMPDWMFRMMYHGEFTKPAGMIYDCIDESFHFCDPFQIPSHWPKYLGLDFGGNNTCAVFWAQDPETGMLYVYHEYRAGGRTAEEHIEYLTEPSQYCDDNTWFDIVAGGAPAEGQWRDEFSSAGLMVEEPSVKTGVSVDVGIQRLYGLLKQRRVRIFRHLNGMGCGDKKSDIDPDRGVKGDLLSYAREIDPDTAMPIPGTIADKASKHFADAMRYAACALTERGIVQIQAVGGERRGERQFSEYAAQVAGRPPQDFIEGEVVSAVAGVLQLNVGRQLMLPTPRNLALR